MREIKFRAWDKTGECKMLRVAELKWEICKDGVERLYFEGRLEDEMGETGTGTLSGFGATNGSEDISPWVLMQYTGLKDKNGKEIYEGDLLKQCFGKHDDGTDLIFSWPVEVFWLDDRLCWGYRAKSMFNIFLDILMDSDLPDAWFEVIGNIYENPELKP